VVGWVTKKKGRGGWPLPGGTLNESQQPVHIGPGCVKSKCSLEEYVSGSGELS